ncbi:MAG: hypothetical protein HFG70_02485 [Hungatella sp.]|jgi:hypothetical protein|nr:hypothetical protein [Hungatella sp.]
MIKKWFLLLMSVCLLSGCTKSNIIPDGNDEQPMSADGIVWDQIWDDMEMIYEDPVDYPFVESVNVGVFPEDNTIKFFLILKEEISVEEAERYAITVVKGFNDLIWAQNSSYAASADLSYGGYVEQFNLHVVVTLEENKENREAWILEDGIPAGTYRPIEAADEMEDDGEEESTAAES